jgi:hypothetical protein
MMAVVLLGSLAFLVVAIVSDEFQIAHRPIADEIDWMHTNICKMDSKEREREGGVVSIIVEKFRCETRLNGLLH